MTVELYTNDIILGEVKRHITTQVDQSVREAKKKIKECAGIWSALSAAELENINQKLLEVPQRLLKKFEDYMRDAVVLSNEEISVAELFDDYFKFAAPFEEKAAKKSEFPDAAVIKSIKHFVSGPAGETICVVSNDKGWHNALRDMPNVYLYRDLKEFLGDVSKTDALYLDIFDYVGRQQTFLEKETKAWLNSFDYTDIVENLDGLDIECDGIDDVYITDISVGLDEIEHIDRQDASAMCNVIGMAEVKVLFTYIDHSEEIYDKEDHVWYNTIFGDGAAWLSVPVDMRLSLKIPKIDETLSIESWEFKNISEEDLSDSPWEIFRGSARGDAETYI